MLGSWSETLETEMNKTKKCLFKAINSIILTTSTSRYSVWNSQISFQFYCLKTIFSEMF